MEVIEANKLSAKAAEYYNVQIRNRCPTRNNTIACRECNLECQLRMQPKFDNSEVESRNKIPPPIIYY